jgi:predicted patatin/cPLA2 family phospholipase
MTNQNYLLCFIILFSIISNCFSFKNKNCYVLALEGGGDKGAYQAGVIKGLIDNLPSNKTRYDVVTGISVGSINAAAFSVFEIGQEKNASDFIINTWREITGTNTVYKNWMLGPLYGLFYKSGLYDTTPLMNFLSTHIKDKKVKRQIVIGSTDVQNATYVTWDESYFQDSDKLIKSVLASAAFPVIFPTRDVDGISYIDGGVKINVDISSGINKCLDMGYDEKNIIIDIILYSSKDKLEEIDKKNLHPIQILLRILEIFGYDNSMKDVENVPINFPYVNVRYIIYPTKKLPYSVLPLVFKPNDIETMINIGIQDGIDAINNSTEEGNGMKVITESRQKRIDENRKRNRKHKNTNINSNNNSSNSFTQEKLRLLK